jgi:hypothetical protein
MCVSHLRQNPSYKLMIQLGFTQLIGIQFAGIYTGFQTIWGTVFCSAPNVKYVVDGLVSIHWIVTSTTCDLLAFNRLCALYSGELARKLFDGKRLYLWMAFPIVYRAGLGFYLYSEMLKFKRFYHIITFKIRTFILTNPAFSMYWKMPPLLFNSQMMAYFFNPHYGRVH